MFYRTFKMFAIIPVLWELKVVGFHVVIPQTVQTLLCVVVSKRSISFTVLFQMFCHVPSFSCYFSLKLINSCS